MPIFSKKVNTLLVDLEKSSEQFWNIPREVAQLLYFLVRSKSPKKILEIGTSNGYSGIWLAQGLAHNQEFSGQVGKLYTVESHDERFSLAQKNFQEAEVSDQVFQIKGHAPEIFETSKEIASGGFDFLFFDATKKQHLDFLQKGLALLNVGGLIVADNILSHWQEMQHFVAYAHQLENLSGELVKIGDGLYVAVKKN